MPAVVGQPAPPFALRDQDRNVITLDSLKGGAALVVFIPFPFTAVCSAEICTLRDRAAELENVDANVVVVTTHALPTNKQWAEENSFRFPVLADYWPHGETARAYGTFNEKLGVADRSTYVLDADGVVRAVIASDSLGTAREFEDYAAALAAIGD